ncbi:T9SS C-terminal target domain-containing protein [Sphingobacteriales bacterium UPWRP_1]|nr:hypothetical protein B6N25_06900 [Sphingobacteriales bacterium TSM_CSS]PSJ77269.1 T9SS C-terminal target domain-containing protein [Sphingobacteriales bacterium UPWRP_1]
MKRLFTLFLFTTALLGFSAKEANAQCAGTYTVTIGACATFLDEVCFEIRNAANTAVFTGTCPVLTAGTFTYVASGTAPNNGPFTFYIETQGTYNDNCATYNVSSGGTTLVSGSLAGGLTFTSSSFCYTPPVGCTAATYGQWPTGTFTPACTGSPEVITTIGYASEYSVVAVTTGVPYTFTSSVATDFITISDATGTTVYAAATTPVSWTATYTGTARFYTHLSNACGASTASRTRSVSCLLSNDDCINAYPLTCGQTVTGTTVGTSNVGNGPTCTTTASTAGSVWYTLAGDGSIVTLSMCTGTSYDSKLFVYTGSCGAFTCVIGDDDGCGGIGPSTVQFAALAGTTYYIMVAGFGTNTGAFTLSASCVALPPPATNDECVTGISLAVPSCGTYGTVGATDSPDPGPSCTDNEFGASYYTSGDVWFNFVMPPSGWVTLTGDNITFFAFIGGTPIAPLGIEIYSGNCAGFTPEQCAIIWDNQADQMLFQGNPGQTYIVRAWDLFDPFEQEGFDLCIEETQPTIASCNATFTDSGGAAGPYQDVERKYYIICGDTPFDDIAKVTFNEFSIESGFDFMTVWDAFGPTGTPLAGPVTGTAWEGTTFEATNPSGCLTFFFESDNVFTDLGWNADVRCVCKQVISVPAAYTDFLCSGETPDFAGAAASIQYQDLQGNPADGSAFTIKWFLNAAWTQPAAPNLTLDYVGTGCNPQPRILYARGTCSTGEFFDAGFMTAIVYPTPEAPQIVLINSGPVCSYAYLPATCPATSFSPATPPNETVGNPPTGTTVSVTSTNGGCSVTYDVVKPMCDACYIPTTITGSACEGLPADFASFEANLETGGVAGLGAVSWYYDDSYSNMVDENAPLNFELGGCTPINVTLYAMGTCLSGDMQPAGQINLTFYPAPEAPTIVALDNFCNYGYAAPACPGTGFLTELSSEDPGDGGQTVSVDVLSSGGCVYTFDVVKPVCQVCELEADFTLIYEAGTGASAFFNYGTINVLSSFVTPLSYQWDIDGYVTYGVPAPGTVNVLYTDESVFYVTITDATGCRTVVTNLETSIDDLSIINAVVTADNGSSTGSINITVAGGDTPYAFAWQGPSGFTSTSEDLSGLIVGWYVISITSADGQSAFGWFWVPKQNRGRGKTDESASIMAYPNPVMDKTNVAFSVAESTDATVTLHSISGQQVGQLFKGHVNGGETVTLPFNASGLPAGVYFARLTTANGEVQNYKLVVGQ